VIAVPLRSETLARDDQRKSHSAEAVASGA
jgi:hypothetical protein